MSELEKSLERAEESFGEYRRLILSEITRLDSNDKAIMAKLETLTQIIIELKVKAALAGAAAGIITSLIVAWLVKRL